MLRFHRLITPPSPRAQLNLGRPMARALAFFLVYAGGGQWIDYVQRARATYNGSLRNKIYRSSRGVSIGARIAAATSDYLELPHNPAYNLIETKSLLWSGRLDTPTGYQCFVSKAGSNGGTANDPFDFFQLNGTPYLYQADAGAYWGMNSAQTLSADVSYQVGVTYDGANSPSNCYFYVNGVEDFAGGQGSARPATGNTDPLRIGRRADGAVQLDGMTEFVVGWDRVLPLTDFISMYANPWQCFIEPGPSIFYSLPSGATSHDASGALTGQNATPIAGTAAHVAKHATSGAMTGAGKVIAGTAARTHQHPSAGVVVGAGATMIGSALHPHVSSGVLSGPNSIVVGIAARSGVAVTHATDGALAGIGSALSASAVRGQIIQGERWLKPRPRPAITIHESYGLLVGRRAIITGQAQHSFDDRNALELLLLST